MWKFIKNLFTNEDRVKAGHYNQLMNAIQSSYTLQDLVRVRKAIIQFKERWGYSPTYKDLAQSFDARVKLVVTLQEKKRKNGSVAQKEGKAEETL